MTDLNGNHGDGSPMPGMNVQPGPVLTQVFPAPPPPQSPAKGVILRLEGTNGSFLFFLDCDHAKGLSKMLAENARNAQLDLIIPQVELPPDFKP